MITIPLLYDYVFPNYILPNALITELGIVNYLHSLNSNRLRPHSFFEQSINSGTDSNNLLTFMFDRSLGTFPNSTGGTGSHLTSNMYHNMVNCEENSLYVGKKKYSKYVYPIRMSPHVHDFCGFSSRGSKLNGEYFWKHMSAEALQDAQNGIATIFLDFAQENFIEKSGFNRLHDCIKYSGIPPNKIVLAFNSFNAKELYESWFNPDERLLEVFNWPFVLSNTSYYYATNPRSYVNELTFNHSQNIIRKNHFLFKIRRPRAYRQALLYKLNDDNLLEKGDWSWLEKSNFDQHKVNEINSYYDLNLHLDKVEELYKKFPHTLSDERSGTFDNISSWTDSNPAPYTNSYLYICTETYASGDYKSITEKICKPMVNMMPFVFMSFPGVLGVLRNLGFKTFSPYIDESYDDEPDDKKRLTMIYEEIKKICSMSIEETHDWYWKMKDIYIHNQNLVLNYYKEDKYTQELVQYLQQRIA